MGYGVFTGRRTFPSALTIEEAADHADPEPKPRGRRDEEFVVLRLQAARREPELVLRRVGDAAVEATPDAVALRPERGRGDRVGPLDRVAALFERAPGPVDPGLADRAEAALEGFLVGRGRQVERVDRFAGFLGLVRRAPVRRFLAFGVEVGHRGAAA